jgi:hypothetical protein
VQALRQLSPARELARDGKLDCSGCGWSFPASGASMNSRATSFTERGRVPAEDPELELVGLGMRDRFETLPPMSLPDERE